MIILKETEGDADEQEGKQGYLAARQCLRCLLLYLTKSGSYIWKQVKLKVASSASGLAFLRPSLFVSECPLRLFSANEV